MATEIYNEGIGRENNQEDGFKIASQSRKRESDWDSDSDSECIVNIAKRCKVEHKVDLEKVDTDVTGHFMWYPGQKIKDFVIRSMLGEGVFGRVVQAKNINTGHFAALKVTKNIPSRRDAKMAEITMLTIIASRDPGRESFCVEMINWFHYGGHLCIAFPLLGVSVFDFLKDNHFEPFSIDEIRHISFQLCSAVAFLHQNGIIHADLKPENMLFVSSAITTVWCKDRNVEVNRLKYTDIRLSDFGLSIRNEDNHPQNVATRYYRPPELILQLDWTNTLDTWSIGCILIELYVGRLLFPANNNNELLAMMEDIIGPIPSEMTAASKTTYFQNGYLDWNWDEAPQRVADHCRPLKLFRMDFFDSGDVDDLFDLVGEMLIHEPHQRIPLSEALHLPFFSKLPASQRVPKKI